MRDGRAILGYLVPWYKILVKAYGISGTIDGRRALILNQGGVNSFVFDSVINKYDVFVRYVKGRDAGWRCSITTERPDIDVSAIAEKYGGGGHMKAAGFRVEKLEDFFVEDV
jgi:oligoribonuclease NrnB/cAMP/cGMP phosphodiesterase (DHH superfamily)